MTIHGGTATHDSRTSTPQPAANVPVSAQIAIRGTRTPQARARGSRSSPGHSTSVTHPRPGGTTTPRPRSRTETGGRGCGVGCPGSAGSAGSGRSGGSARNAAAGSVAGSARPALPDMPPAGGTRRGGEVALPFGRPRTLLPGKWQPPRARACHAPARRVDGCRAASTGRERGIAGSRARGLAGWPHRTHGSDRPAQLWILRPGCEGAILRASGRSSGATTESVPLPSPRPSVGLGAVADPGPAPCDWQPAWSNLSWEGSA